MKKFIRTAVAAIAALALTTAIVGATVSTVSQERIEISSQSCPALDCSMSIDDAGCILALLPDSIRRTCRSEYAHLSRRCQETGDFSYQGVKVHTSSDGGRVDITFSYGGYTVRVRNTTWERLDTLFR